MVYFQAKNPNLGKFGLAVDVGIFNVHLLYFTDTCHILWTFGTFPGYLVYFPPFWYVVARKSGNPGSEKALQF
jgi:hypothetical protein